MSVDPSVKRRQGGERPTSNYVSHQLSAQSALTRIDSIPSLAHAGKGATACKLTASCVREHWAGTVLRAPRIRQAAASST